MPKETVLIGSRLPYGLTIRHPDPAHSNVTATIAGMNSAIIKGATFVTTEVDAELWAAWKVAYSDYVPLRSGAIFQARNADEAKFKAKDLAKEKTGFEPLKPTDYNVKPADKN
jgi:hypothetical protein